MIDNLLAPPCERLWKVKAAMRVKQISVKNLFGVFDHVIPLNLEERITIIHGPNGFGKTIIFELLNGFFNLRWVSLRHDHALRFEGLKYRAFTDLDTLTISQSGLLKTIKDHSQKPQLSDEELRRQIEAIKDDAHERWMVCCGRDLLGILSVGLHKALGSWDWKEIETEILERSLRLAYESIWFRATQLHASIRRWEEFNAPFQVLAIDVGTP